MSSAAALRLHSCTCVKTCISSASMLLGALRLGVLPAPVPALPLPLSSLSLPLASTLSGGQLSAPKPSVTAAARRGAGARGKERQRDESKARPR